MPIGMLIRVQYLGSKGKLGPSNNLQSSQSGDYRGRVRVGADGVAAN